MNIKCQKIELNYVNAELYVSVAPRFSIASLQINSPFYVQYSHAKLLLCFVVLDFHLFYVRSWLPQMKLLFCNFFNNFWLLMTSCYCGSNKVTCLLQWFWQALIPTIFLPFLVLGAILFFSCVIFRIVTLCALRLICWVVFSPLLSEISTDSQILHFIYRKFFVSVDPFWCYISVSMFNV